MDKRVYTTAEQDDRYRRAIASHLSHSRLSGRPLELILELVQLLASGSIRAGDCDRVLHRAKCDGLEDAVDLARFQAKTVKNKRGQRSFKQ
jgi:hypothetical protein